MAFYDWNHDGKKDFVDDYIEYNSYKSWKEQHEKSSHTSGGSGEMSGFGTFLCVISGLVWQALLYTALDIEVENVPVFVMIVLWVLFSAITAVVAEVLRSR